MTRTIKFFVSILTFIVLVIAGIVFVFEIRSSSVQKKFEEIRSKNLNAQVDIYTNKQGIPHIIATNDEDMFFAMGYFHAKERLWSICHSKIIAEGRAAEFYGENFLQLDLYMRTLDLRKIANELYENANDETKTVLTAYANGINSWIENNINRLTFEFGASDFLPEEWHPSDCFLIQRYFAFLLNPNFLNDIIFAEIAQKIGVEKTLELVPNYPNNSPHILDENRNRFIESPTPELDSLRKSKAFNLSQYDNLRCNNFTYSQIIGHPELVSGSSAEILKQVQNDSETNTVLPCLTRHPQKSQEIPHQVRYDSETLLYNNDYKHEAKNQKDFLRVIISHSAVGKKGSNLGSNTWATNKEHTILANDSHLPLTIPNFWMQMHITSPNYNVVGLVIPGMPIFLCGRNNYIAWGSANMLVDDVDYLIQKVDADQINYFINDSIKKPITEIIDTVKIRNKNKSAKKDDYIYYKRSVPAEAGITNYKLQITDYNIISNLSFLISNSANNTLTYKWTGQQKSNEIYAMLKVMRANNWKSFLAAINDWNSPGMVFSYADKNGNIGIAPRALIPIRAKDVVPFLPYPFWKNNNIWVDYVKPNALPVLYNPSKKFVSASNNGVLNNSMINNIRTNYISSYFALDSRAKRIEEMLITGENYSYRDAQYMQNDILSFYAKDYLTKIFFIFKKYEHLLTAEEKKAYYKLLKWDFMLSLNSTAATIYSMFISQLVKNTFADKLDDLYDFYIFNSNFPLAKLNELLANPISEWFDDSRTEEREHLEFAVINSFKEAIKELSNLYGTENSDKWKYNLHHKINFRHSYNMFSFLDKATHIGSFAVGGDMTTINTTEWKLNKPFDVVLGASMRFIADMTDDIVYTVLPGGTSGDPMSPNYSDQIQLWQIGAYVKLSISEVPTPDFKLILTLRAK